MHFNMRRFKHNSQRFFQIAKHKGGVNGMIPFLTAGMVHAGHAHMMNAEMESKRL